MQFCSDHSAGFATVAVSCAEPGCEPSSIAATIKSKLLTFMFYLFFLISYGAKLF